MLLNIKRQTPGLINTKVSANNTLFYNDLGTDQQIIL